MYVGDCYANYVEQMVMRRRYHETNWRLACSVIFGLGAWAHVHERVVSFSRPWKGSSFGCYATVNARSAERRYLKWISKFTSLQFFRKTMQWCHITCAKGCAFVRGDLWICLNFHSFSDLSCVVCRVSCGCMSCGPAILFSSFVLVTSMLFAIAPGMSLLSTFAGQHTPNNSSIMPGMGLNRDKNSYLYPEYQVLFCAMPPVYVVCMSCLFIVWRAHHYQQDWLALVELHPSAQDE